MLCCGGVSSETAIRVFRYSDSAVLGSAHVQARLFSICPGYAMYALAS